MSKNKQPLYIKNPEREKPQPQRDTQPFYQKSGVEPKKVNLPAIITNRRSNQTFETIEEKLPQKIAKKIDESEIDDDDSFPSFDIESTDEVVIQQKQYSLPKQMSPTNVIPSVGEEEHLWNSQKVDDNYDPYIILVDGNVLAEGSKAYICEIIETIMLETDEHFQNIDINSIKVYKEVSFHTGVYLE